MFNLDKTFAQLKSFLEDNNLTKESVNDETLVLPDKNGTPKQKKNKKTKKTNKDNKDIIEDKRGVIMIKNFPHGFYEQQMFDYFSQFGEVTRLKIMRSRKTGKPKNYGFVEFRFKDVAQIAAETMNNYLMFNHIVKCNLIPEDKIRVNLFKNWDRPFISSIQKHKQLHNQVKTNEQELRSIQRHLKRVRKMEDTLKDKGIHFQCVIINRPDNLEQKQKLERKSLNSVHKTPEEIIQMSKPRIKPSKINRKRRIILPKFWKILAAL